MSVLTRIEKELQAINEAKFQELCDAYLHRLGYRDINVIGRAVGAEKTRTGTPDTLFVQPDGKYVFAEYCTQKTGLAGKFRDDLAKCFDSRKTGIPPGCIREIVLCHNRRLGTRELHDLQEECARHGALLSSFGLDVLAQDLYSKYAALARDFLNIEVDTGQVLCLEDFLDSYHKSPLATPLRTSFRFREDQVQQIIQLLQRSDIVLITGRPGVGKTRVAVECCRRYAATHGQVEVRCIWSRGPDLFQDLRVHLSAPGHYLVFVDDANRITRFEYVCQLLLEPRTDRTVRVMATVRDYALDRVRDEARLLGDLPVVQLESFTDKQITELVCEEFGVRNFVYQERIARIASGNARLAVMAARVAARKNTFESIADASQLYDEYFSSIRRDLVQLPDASTLRAAAIVAFFRVVDRSNEEQMRIISTTFGMSPDIFWGAVRRLHDVEAVDIYEDEVARVSDQVLSTYLFYRAVFKEKHVDLQSILTNLLPHFRERIVEALTPVLSVFQSDELYRELARHVDPLWRSLEESGETERLWQVMKLFWFLNPSHTLEHIRQELQRVPPEPLPVSDLKFEPDWGTSGCAPILELLAQFRWADEASFVTMAVELILRYVQLRPKDLPFAIRVFVRDFGVTRYSHLNGFRAERCVLDAVWVRADTGKDELFSRLFLAISEPFLHTHFQTHEATGAKALTIYQFDVPCTPDLLDLRRSVWQRVFELFDSPSLRDAVLGLLEEHTRSGYLVANTEIGGSDAGMVMPFLRSSLEPSSFRHCVVVHGYLELLDRLGVPADEELKERFTTDAWILSELLTDDRFERSSIGWEEYQQVKRERLTAYVARLSESELMGFLARCAEIHSVIRGTHREHSFRQGVQEALLLIADRDVGAFEYLLTDCLKNGDQLGIGTYGIVAGLINASGPDRAHKIVSSAGLSLRTRWLLTYYVALPPSAAREEHLDELFPLYEIADLADLPFDLDYLLKFSQFDDAVVTKITGSILRKTSENPAVGRILSVALCAGSEVAKNLPTIFGNDLKTLKRAYFAACRAGEHYDYDGALFNAILDLDCGFASEWVSWVFERERWPREHDDSRNYAFIWWRDDYASVMAGVAEGVYTQERAQGSIHTYLNVFFKVENDRTGDTTIRQRQDAFLDQLIAQRNWDGDFMAVLFSVISEFSAERRRARLATFLRCNTDPETFRHLPLEPNHWGYSGSAVPMLQGRIDFLESLLPIFNTVELLPHRQRVEDEIRALRIDIEREKRRDFIRD